MKITKSWLDDHLDTSGSTAEICHELTMAGLEVDEISKIDNDDIIDIDLTPNRSDCLSVSGISRELKSINNKYKEQIVKENNASYNYCENTKINFTITNKEVCPRYGYIFLKNVDSECALPEVISTRLQNIGIKSIHPIVDLLNYLMIDFGQPMHAYDADKISGDISVRYAKQNESFKALDGTEYQLTSDNIVISDSKKIISLAGIIGSQDSAVTKKTKNIIIESAFFNPKLLANKARKLKLQTESSHRFERGVDCELPIKALKKLIDIINEIKICEFSNIKIIEDVISLPAFSDVGLNFEKIRSQIGINIQNTEIIELLLSIGCKYNKEDNSVTNPSYRYDLSVHADYVEEVARLYGYDNIPASPEKLSISPNKKYIPFEIINKIKQYLYKNSYSECINFSFVNDDLLENYDWKNNNFEKHKKISNFMSTEQNKLRSNLVSSLIKNIQYNNNVNTENSHRFFEISNVFDVDVNQVLSCVVHGDRYDENWSSKNRKFDKYDMTTIVEDLSSIFGLEKSDFDYQIKEIIDNKSKYITLTLSIDCLIRKIDNNLKEKFVHYSKLPYIRRDLSFLIDVNIEYQSILELIQKINVHSLKKILLFDLYIGKNVPKGEKSLGLAFIFQDDTKTLTHEEADIYVGKIVKSLEDEFKIELRK